MPWEWLSETRAEGQSVPVAETYTPSSAGCSPHTHTNSPRAAAVVHARRPEHWTQRKTHSDVWRPETLQNSSACGLFRGQPYYDGSSEGTAVHLKQALCSWDRHGYHQGNKNKNSNNKEPGGQQVFSHFPLFWGSSCWPEQLCVDHTSGETTLCGLHAGWETGLLASKAN